MKQSQALQETISALLLIEHKLLADKNLVNHPAPVITNVFAEAVDGYDKLRKEACIQELKQERWENKVKDDRKGRVVE
jgi:hypothetical protein